MYDCDFMRNSKIPFLVFGPVWFLRCAWILHNTLYTMITLIQKPVVSTCLSWSWVPYNAACIPNYCVPPYSIIPIYIEGAGLIPQLKMILMYCSKCQRQVENWFIFSFQHVICIPVRIECKYKNNPHRFCYICINVVLPNRQEKITDCV